MPSTYNSGGDARETAWLDAHPDQVVDGSSRPGYVYMQPNNQFGAPAGWITVDEFNQKYHQGWTAKQILAAAAPLLAGGVGALAGGGAAAVPDIATTSGFGGSGFGGAAAGAGTTAATAGTTAAGAAAKGAGMAFGVKDAVQLAPLVASLFSKPAGNGQPPQQDAMNGLINMQTQRLQQSDPLYQAILKMAMGLMPTAYQGGFAQPTSAPAAAPSTNTAVPRVRR